MARTKKELQPIDAEIAKMLDALVTDSGLTRRQLADLTGMSINRIGIILRKEPPPATIGELSVLATALGSSASTLLSAAEASVRSGARADYDLVANDSINEHPAGEDADFD